MKFKRAVYTLFLAALMHAALSQNASAYLDPGTGSFVFQILVAAFLGGLFTIKAFWKKIAAFLGGVLSRKRTS